MSHRRERGIEKIIAKSMTYSPCVGVMGMRQVGKTTLLKKFAKTYYTFDEPGFDLVFERRGISLVEKAPSPVGLDEIQKHPPAFDAVKYCVDRVKRMGRFLLSGSVRFSSRRQIRESLTGRIVSVEVHPLSLSECHGKPANSFIELVGKSTFGEIVSRLGKRAWAKNSHLEHYLKTGGLPGICFRRDEKIRNELFEAHLDTLLGRDIHLIRKTDFSPATLRNLLVEMARHQGRRFPTAELARVSGISRLSAIRILSALEGLFLIRRYGEGYFIEDAGLSFHLNPQFGPLTLGDRIRALYYEFRWQQSLFTRHETKLEPYATRGGIDLPFFIQYKSGESVGIAVSEDDVPTDKSLKTFTWLRKKFPRLKSVILCASQDAFVTGSNILCMPWLWVF